MDRAGELDDDDIARLADRLAVLLPGGSPGPPPVGTPGRKVLAMAHKLGLVGGRSMEVFMTGAAATLAVGLGGGLSAGQAADLDRLRREIDGLIHTQQQLDRAVRQAQAEAADWQAEADRLRESLDRIRARARLRTWIAAALAFGLLGGGLFLTVGPGGTLLPVGIVRRLTHGSPAEGRPASVLTRMAPLWSQPESGGAPLASLPAGTAVVVVRVFWNNLMQWAEVQAGERRGYMQVSDLLMS